MSTNWDALAEEHEIAYLRGGLATSSPQSYTVEEMAEISDAMTTRTAEAEAAMRTDFAAMPPDLQSKMMMQLEKADHENIGRWKRLLYSGGETAERR